MFYWEEVCRSSYDHLSTHNAFICDFHSTIEIKIGNNTEYKNNTRLPLSSDAILYLKGTAKKPRCERGPDT